MRRVDYDRFRREELPRLLRRRVVMLNAFPGRTPRQRPRDPEEEAVLCWLIQARYRRLIESGELVCIGPRRWRWTFPALQ